MSESESFPYSTHAEALMRGVLMTTGPIAECGVGWCSTPLLHGVSELREVFSFENKMEWLAKFTFLETPRHHFSHVTDWMTLRSPVLRFGLAFIDLDPGAQRVDVIMRFRPIVDVFVVHDTEPGCWPGYKWNRIQPAFKYVANDTRYSRWTTILSDRIALP